MLYALHGLSAACNRWQSKKQFMCVFVPAAAQLFIWQYILLQQIKLLLSA